MWRRWKNLYGRAKETDGVVYIFFLNRGKPSTHIEALSKIEDKSMVASMPIVFGKIIAAAEKKLQGDVL